MPARDAASRSQPQSPGPDDARCVVLHAPGTDPDAQLLAALERQGLPATCEPSPHRALARVCLGSSAGRMVLLLAPDGAASESASESASDSASDPARIARAVERYAPDAAVWIHEPGANPPVRAFVEETVPLPTEPEPAARRPSGGSPMLRLIDAGPDAGVPEPEPTASRVLTQDEMSLLLESDRTDP